MPFQLRLFALAPIALLCWIGPLRQANALDPLPSPPPVPSPTPVAVEIPPLQPPPPLPTPTAPVLIIPNPTPTPNPSAPTVEETIPVIIAYGDGTETHAQVVRGIMRP